MRNILVSLVFIGAASSAFAGRYVCVSKPHQILYGRVVTMDGFRDPCDVTPTKTVKVHQGTSDNSEVIYSSEIDISEEGNAHGTQWVPHRYSAPNGTFSLKGGWCGARQRTVQVINLIGATWETYDAECIFVN